MIYLDHNATTPLDEHVKVAMREALNLYGNPSSSHRAGRDARAAIDHARQQVADLIGAEPSEVIFTSGGTEANNLAIIGTAFRHGSGHIITTAIEHPAVLKPLAWLEGRGFGVTYVPVNGQGRVDPDHVKDAIRPDTILITVMHSNNETGVLQPVKEAGAFAAERFIAFHSDAAQSVGKVPVDVREEPVDMLTIVPHKFNGPKGAGALYIRGFGKSSAAGGPSKPPHPILFGAGHERGLRPGTENVVGIVGTGEACERAGRELQQRHAHTQALRDMLFGLLSEALEVRLNGHRDLRLPNTLNLSIRGILAEDLVALLREEVAFSSGSACHAGTRHASAVLKAMGLDEGEALAAVRLTTGKDTTAEEVRKASRLIIRFARSLLQSR